MLNDNDGINKGVGITKIIVSIAVALFIVAGCVVAYLNNNARNICSDACIALCDYNTACKLDGIDRMFGIYTSSELNKKCKEDCITEVNAQMNAFGKENIEPRCQVVLKSYKSKTHCE